MTKLVIPYESASKAKWKPGRRAFILGWTPFAVMPLLTLLQLLLSKNSPMVTVVSEALSIVAYILIILCTFLSLYLGSVAWMEEHTTEARYGSWAMIISATTILLPLIWLAIWYW